MWVVVLYDTHTFRWLFAQNKKIKLHLKFYMMPIDKRVSPLDIILFVSNNTKSGNIIDLHCLHPSYTVLL